MFKFDLKAMNFAIITSETISYLKYKSSSCDCPAEAFRTLIDYV